MLSSKELQKLTCCPKILHGIYDMLKRFAILQVFVFLLYKNLYKY